MRAHSEYPSHRSGFTLTELLVVIAIIAVLMGLIGAGVFAVYNTQRRNNTQHAIRGVYKPLARQIKIVFEKADKETIPPSVTSMAAGDPKLARIIWKKLRLKQEFPMTFAEAVAPYNTAGFAFAPTAPMPLPFTPLSASELPPIQAYVTALKNAGIAQQNGDGSWSVIKPANNNTLPASNPNQQFLESSTLVLLALQQNRGGVEIPADVLGAYARDLNNDGLKELVDGWNNPIAFFRYPTSNDLAIAKNSDLDAANPAAAGSTAATYRDPYDPQGLLLNPNWNNWGNYNGGQGVFYFEQLCHLVHSPNASAAAAQGTYSPWPRYMVPVLVSAGPDAKFGLNSMFGTYAGINPDMSIDGSSPATISASIDNIYSYQLNLD